MFVLDCGSGNGTFLFDSETKTGSRIPNEDFINLSLPGIKPGDTVVIEDAHVRTRETQSTAQPFTIGQLRSLKKKAEEMGVEILLFPQQSTPKARAFSEITEKTDPNDIRAIAHYLETNPAALKSLKKFNPIGLEEYRSLHESRWEDKDLLSEDINRARTFKYGFLKDNPYSDSITKWIDSNSRAFYNLLTEEQRDLLKFKFKFKGKSNERLDWNEGRFYTLVATLMKADGGLRLRSDVGKLPYWKYVKENYFGMTPYHMKGGVAASNVKYHWRRHASGFAKVSREKYLKDGKYEEWRQARSDFDKELRNIWNCLRGLILETV